MSDDKGLIVVGSIAGALIGGIPGAITGGLIGSIVQEFIRCPICKATMFWDNTEKKYRCLKCGYQRRN